MELQDRLNNSYTAKTWFQVKCEDPQTRHLWIKARILYTFKQRHITALYLFGYGISESRQKDSQMSSQRAIWSAQAHSGIRRLFDRIVTRWMPVYLTQTFIISSVLHKSLTPEHLLRVPQIFDNSPDELDFNVETAQRRYEKCFIPLLYHELWENIKHDIKSMTSETLFRIDGDIEIQIMKYVPETAQAVDPSEPSVNTMLIFGSYFFQTDLLFNRTLPKLALCDIVLINIGVQDKRHSFFAVVVDVVDHWPSDMEKIADIRLTKDDEDKHIIQVKSDVVLYTSKKCSNAIQKNCPRLGGQKMSVVKLTNITSSRRQISAIYNLSKFSKQKSLLKPSNTDLYFHREHFPNVTTVTLKNFNDAQMRVIDYAERIFRDNTTDRLHLVHGPPGTGKSKTIAGIVVKILPQLGKKTKILLCAPSNNACNELSKRILNEIPAGYEKGTLVRVGREAPLDHFVCEHFLESLTLQKLVERIQNGESVTYETADSIKHDIIENAKLIVSTLNYSANNTLLSIKKQGAVKFIIIDE
ncbi:unnamed protein product, partial [Rotaria sp. Silwood2]